MEKDQEMMNVVDRLKSMNVAAESRMTDLRRMKTRISNSKEPAIRSNTATVFILTFCRNLELFYGTELIFKTLRIGFPNANIVVVDNASIPEARDQIETLAKQNDCFFEYFSRHPIQHHQFIEHAISAAASNERNQGPVIFLDPDVCLWESCEDFDFAGIIAGRLIGKFDDPLTQTVTMPRLHTSFMWIPDARRLQDAIRKTRIRRFDFEPFASYSFIFEGTWYRYNTGSGLYAAFPDRVSRFAERHLNCYDHIFCGSHIDWLLPRYDPETREIMLKVHASAKKGDLEALKGLWKLQTRMPQNNRGKEEREREVCEERADSKKKSP